MKQLIDAYFDDELSNADLRQFEDMLKADRTLQKQLIRESYFHLRLRTGLTAVSQVDLALNNLDEAVLLDQQLNQDPILVPPVDMGSPGSFGEVLGTTILNVLSSAKFLWMIMFFSIGLFSMMVFMLLPKDWALDGPGMLKKVTHVSQTVDAVWGEGIQEDDLKILFTGSRLDLLSGLAQVEYESGVRVNLEGPTIFIVSGENEGTLISGKISAQMATGAEKFTIKTPVGKVVDLGTEFGVIVDPNKNTEVQVFDGKVKLTIARKNGGSIPVRSLELVETNAVRVNSAERTVADIPYTPLRFARSYKKLRPYYYDDFSTDTSGNYAILAGDCTVQDGMMQVNADSTTCSVISKRPLLGTGEVFMVEVPGVDPDISEVYAVVSTQPTPPTGGAGGPWGFRLRREQGLVVEKIDSSQASSNTDPMIVDGTRIDDPLFGRTIRLVIERHTATDFVFYYESNDGRTRMTGTIQNLDLENSKRLYVGVEVRARNGEDVKVFDNIIVYPLEEQ